MLLVTAAPIGAIGFVLAVVGFRSHIVVLDVIGFLGIVMCGAVNPILSRRARRQYRALLVTQFHIETKLTELPRNDPACFEEWRTKWVQEDKPA